MDFNKMASDIITELKRDARRTDAQIAERLGISRQAYLRRRDTNSLTTENVTVLSAWLVTAFGGGFYLDNIFNEPVKVKGNIMNTIKLSNVQLEGIVKLINEEIDANQRAGDAAYNTYWEEIKMALGYAIIRK